MLTFEDLRTPVSSATAEASVIQRLSELGFASYGWQSGDPQLTLVKLISWGYSRFTVMVAALANGGTNDTASGDFLTKFSKSAYDNTRKLSQAAQLNITMTTATGEGPHSFGVDELIATDGVSTYRNKDAGTATDAAPIIILFECEAPGAAGGAATGAIDTLVTTLSGVTIENADIEPVQAGADAESDAPLRVRNSTKWATLAIDMPEAGYRNVALGVDGVDRAKVDHANPRGPGTVDVYIAAGNAPAGPTEETAVQTAIDARRTVFGDVDVILPATQTVTVAGIVYMDRAYFTGSQALIEAAIEGYVNTRDIGGEDLDGVNRGVTLDGIIEAIRAVQGVRNVNLTSPADDVVLSAFDLAVADVTGIVAQRL